ncbi:hypothetical protein Tco_0462643 [Tanacetum coccineum]
MPNIEKYVTESLGAKVLVRSTNQPQTTYAVEASLSEFELKKILIDKMEANKSINRSDNQKNLYNALVESYNSNKDITTSYGDVEPSHTVEDSSMQQDQEFVMGDDDKRLDDKEVNKADCQAARAKEPPTSFDEFNDTLFDFSVFVMNRLKIPNLTQEILVGPAFNLLKGTCKSITELEYHLEECFRATTERLDWHNPKNKPYPFDLRKPLPLIQDHRGRQIIPKDYFINKNLEYLKGEDLRKWYSTSVTKTKAATYELKWIEDLVHELWSLVVVKYDQHAYLGTSHWGPKCQSFYGYANQFKRKSLMCTDELHKFSDGTFNDVRTALHDIAAGIRMEYLPMRKWSNLDKKRAWDMVQDIDKQLYQKRLMRNLEMFVGGRIYGKELRVLERTI